MDKIRLLIVTEDPSSRRGLISIFASESMFVVLGAFSPDEAIEKSVLLQPDMVLIDMIGNVLEYVLIISQIKNECPCSLILSIVENADSEALTKVLEQGLDGCIPRGIMRGCLVKTVELACQTGLFCLPGYTKRMVSFSKLKKDNNIDEIKNVMSNSSETLSKREMEILKLMAQNYSNGDIAGKLYISIPTVKTHVSSILRKLGQQNRAQAIVYSYKIGLIYESL